MSSLGSEGPRERDQWRLGKRCATAAMNNQNVAENEERLLRMTPETRDSSCRRVEKKKERRQGLEPTHAAGRGRRAAVLRDGSNKTPLVETKDEELSRSTGVTRGSPDGGGTAKKGQDSGKDLGLTHAAGRGQVAAADREKCLSLENCYAEGLSMWEETSLAAGRTHVPVGEKRGRPQDSKERGSGSF